MRHESIAVISGVGDDAGPIVLKKGTAGWAINKLSDAAQKIDSTWNNAWTIKHQAHAMAVHAQTARNKKSWDAAKKMDAEADRILRKAAEQDADNAKWRSYLGDFLKGKASLTLDEQTWLAHPAGLPKPSHPVAPFPRDAVGLGLPIALAIFGAKALVILGGIAIAHHVVNSILSHFDGSANSAEYTKQLALRNQHVLSLVSKGVAPEKAMADNPPPPKPEGGIPFGKIGLLAALALGAYVFVNLRKKTA